MGERKRDDGGLFVETVTLEDVREAVREGADPISTTGDVAEALGISTESARSKLTELYEQGRIERRKVGAAAVVWWVDE